MDGVIHKRNDEGHTTEEMAPIIHMAKTFAIDSENDAYNSKGDESES